MPLRTVIKRGSTTVIQAFRRSHSTKGDVFKIRSNSSLFQDIFPDNARSEISSLLQSGQQCVYAGFDPTADSLHVGNLLVLINLLHWQRAGHRTIAVIGGATAQIGDPSGRSTERPELAEQKALNNAAGLEANIQTIYRNHEEIIWRGQQPLLPVLVYNNLSWYKDLDFVRFMADVGRHFRVGTMLSRHSVQTRMASEAGISFTEFSYQLFQAYDWLHLYRNHDCRFQIGGNDQMGNIVSGHDLISRTENQKVYGLTLPLVTSEAGDKFGKSAGNAVWLDPKKTSPFELYQFFIRTPDSIVSTLLKLFTFLPDSELLEITQQQQVKPELRTAQRTLAEQVTLLVHGEKGLRSAELATSTLYKQSLDSLSQLSAEEVHSLFGEASCREIKFRPESTALELAMDASCFPTEADAKRIIKAGGFSINNKKITDPSEIINSKEHMLPNGITLLRVGKKNYYVLKWQYS
ncbi:hypothetical protein B566_EDAN015330 [Ephemera danica]|nr:hypothetical protein B566_EDAN015330 [Ephemera danica]